jgi:hypothetical protein
MSYIYRMTTYKNLFSKTKSVMRKNAEFISHLAPDADLSKISFTKMSGGENMLRKVIKYGSDNYKNLKEKIPILGKNGAPLEFKIGSKTFFRIYKPDFSEGYIPKKGFENIFIHPDDGHHFSSGKQKLLTRKGKTMKRGGNIWTVGFILTIIIFFLFLMGFR